MEKNTLNKILTKNMIIKVTQTGYKPVPYIPPSTPQGIGVMVIGSTFIVD